MDRIRKAWLVRNSASGSNTPAALDMLDDCLERYGFSIERMICLPEEPLPRKDSLASSDVGAVMVYGGDGTITSALEALSGWGGAVLPLPGGTMNLLCKRLHRGRTLEDILAIVASGCALPVRPTLCRTSHGAAMVSLLAGPGSRWGEVRESMREGDLGEMASIATETISEMTGTALVKISDPEVGEPAGYPLIEIAPGEFGLALDVYDANNAFDYAAHTLALLRRNFREGPHKGLGVFERLVLESADGSPLELLLDGEPHRGNRTEEIVIAHSEVDLLATGHGE